MSLDEAFKALAYAREECKDFEVKRDPLLLRDAGEKAWLAVIIATDILLLTSGMGKPSSYKERKNMLRALVAKKPMLAKPGIDDKFYARAYKLHILGFHEGILDPEDVEEELKKSRGIPEDLRGKTLYSRNSGKVFLNIFKDLILFLTEKGYAFKTLSEGSKLYG